MGIDRGGMCDTGESYDSFIARVNAKRREEKLSRVLSLTEKEVANLKRSVAAYRKKPFGAPDLVLNEGWLKSIEKLIHDWEFLRGS
jgi:hypothetical protein